MFCKHTLRFNARRILLSLGALVCLTAAAHLHAQPAPTSGASLLDQLAEPAAVERLKLTPEQTAKIADLKAKRTEALNAAPPEKKGEVAADFEKQAAALLTPEQNISAQNTATEPRLKFNFRHQKWLDVLDWFAKQSDLSLVLDAPPPGSFNYTDERDYTPAEAIDLLNGVLNSKGYTLVRRNRMLLLIDLQGGIPEDSLPRITIEELDKRGRYEFVSILFPLEGRDPKAVNDEIKPLLGPHGKSAPLPQTKQILISDTAGIMRSIKAVIDSIPKPSAPPAPPKKDPPPPPVLRIYSADKLDLDASVKVLNALIPNAKVIPDPKTLQLNIHAPEAEQEIAKTVIDQMLAKAEAPAEEQPRLEVYPLSKADTTEVLTALQSGVPSAKFTVNERRSQLIAWAVAADQEKIKSALDRMVADGATPANTARRIQVYRLEKGNPRNLIAVLQDLVPNAQLAADPASSSLIAIATDADHQQIKTMIDELVQGNEDLVDPEIRHYPIPNGVPPQLTEAVAAVSPAAKLVPNLKDKRLMVIAKPKDQEKIKTLIEKFQQEAPTPEKPQLVNYPVTEWQSARFNAIFPSLATDLPDLKIVATNEPGMLSLWGTPTQHALIAEVLEGLKQNAPYEESFQLTLVPLKQAAEGASILASLQTMFPAAKITHDSANGRLMLWSNSDEAARIQAAVEKLQSNSLELRFYPFPEGVPASLTTALTSFVPKAQVTSDTKGKRLMVIATPEDHEKVKSTIEKVVAEAPLPTKGKLVSYPVTGEQKSRFDALLSTLSTDFPDLKVIPSTKVGILTIWAPPEQHARFEELLAELGKEVEPGEELKLAVFPLKHADGSTTLNLLQTLFPSTKITFDSQTGRISVFGTPQQHDAVKQALEAVDTEEPPERQEKFMIYPVHDLDPGIAVNLLQQVAPKARVIQDTRARTLVVYGRQHDQELVAKTLSRLQEEATATTKMRLEVYPVGTSGLSTISNLIRNVAPEARIMQDQSTGGILAWAVPADHEKIAASLKELQIHVTERDQPILETYTLKKTAPSNAYSLIASAAPEVRMSYSSDPTKLNVWGLPSDQEVVRKIVDKLEAEAGDQDRETMVIYSVPTTGGAYAYTPLKTAVPRATISYSQDPEKIIVWARPDEHEKIAAMIQELEAKSGTDDQLSMQVYTIKEITAGTAINILQRALPKVGFTPDNNDYRRFVAWGRPKDHEQIAKLILQFDKKSADGDVPYLQIYTMPKSGASQAYNVANRLAPYASINLSSDQTKLIVWARKSEHEAIKEVTDRIEEAGNSDPESTLVVYSVPTVGAGYLYPLIARAVPKATYTVGSDPSQLMVWARPEDHILVKKIVDGVKDAPQGEAGGEVVVYKVTVLPAASTLPMLQRAVPKASFSMGQDQQQLVVWARPQEHEIIKKLLDQLEASPPDQNRGDVVVYNLHSIGAPYAIPVLQKAVPRATFSTGADPNKLVVWAQPAEHEVVKKVVEQLEAQGGADDKFELAVYDIQKAGASNALAVLQRVLPRVTFTTGADPGKIIAWAKPADQLTIRKLVENLNQQLDSAETASKVYVFKNSDPQAAYTALSTLVPTARLALDINRRSIIATATPKDQEKLAKAIEEIEGSGAEGGPIVRSYSTGDSEPLSVWNMIYHLFQGRTDTKVTVDTDNRAIVISGPEAQHKIVQDVLDEILKNNLQLTLEQHPVKEADPTAVNQIVTQLLRNEMKRVRITVDTDNGQLIVFGAPRHHQIVKDTIERLQREKQSLEVLTLEEVDVFAAESAIRRMLNGPGSKGPAVTLDSDYDKQQLYIRATPSQMEEIRELLGKMGERLVASTVVSPKDRGNTRTIRFEGNLEDALKQIQGVWPRVRKNEIKVITPSATNGVELKTPAGSAVPTNAPPASFQNDTDAPVKNDTEEESLDDALEAAVNEISENELAQNEISNTAAEPGSDSPLKSDDETAPQPTISLPTPEPAAETKTEPNPFAEPETQQPPPASPEIPPTADEPIDPPIAPEVPASPEAQVAPEAPTQPAVNPESAPILVVPGDGEITISSEDTEALDQLENLLQNLSRPERTRGGKDFAIFMLKNTGAKQVADNLEDLFGVGQNRGNRGRSNPGGPTIVADERINAVLVHGSRTDRDAIEGLLKVMDSPEILEFRSDRRTQRFVLKNARAARVEQVLRDLYRSQISTNSNRQPIPIPSGASLEVITAIQTINAAIASPILTLTIDEVTNSVIALGPEPIVAEVAKVVEDLDKGAVEDLSRKLSIIPLKRMNSEHARRALDAILQDSVRPGRARPRNP